MVFKTFRAKPYFKGNTETNFISSQTIFFEGRIPVIASLRIFFVQLYLINLSELKLKSIQPFGEEINPLRFIESLNTSIFSIQFFADYTILRYLLFSPEF